MPPRPPSRLPPLPHPSTWNKHFPSKFLPLSPDKENIRKTPGRILLANPSLADQFVRSIPIRKGEVFIEGYAGIGSVTRSLLNGGREGVDGVSWKRPDGVEVQEEGIGKKGKKKVMGYPAWENDIPSASASSRSAEGKTNTTATERDLPSAKGKKDDPSTSASDISPDTPPRPRLVVASEGSLELLQRGYDYPLSAAAPVVNSGKSNTMVVQSPYDPNLLVSHSSVYVWPTLPSILSHERVRPHLPVHDPTLEGSAMTKRPWEAAEPPITLVCQVPDSSIGEQLVAQWVGSAVGDLGQERTWIWEWGRVRMALLCGQSLYDRLTAKPGELIHCKLSILARALFDLTPLPPLHHVQNVDRQSKMTKDRPIKFVSTVPKSTAPPVRMPQSFVSRPTDPGLTQVELDSPESFDTLSEAARWSKKTFTYPGDFWPHHHPGHHGSYPISPLSPSSSTSTSTSTSSSVKSNLKSPAPANSRPPLPRPPLLGLMLTPKLESPILASQKDAWDYVMRRLFVRDTLTVGEAMSNISFGADALIPRLESLTEEFRGLPVDRMRVVRELEVEEWARIVDVFDQWAFKPENLILDSGTQDEFHRELGRD